MNPYAFVNPLDARYYGPDEAFRERLRPYASEEATVSYYLRIEAALVATLADFELCDHEVARQVAEACEQVTAAEVYEEEERIQHNIRAVVNCIRKRLPEEARGYVHLFATSSDIMDTASALRYGELARDVLIPDLLDLQSTLIEMARRHRETPQIGRTHGMHAEPITFGYALALYVNRIGDRAVGLDMARRDLRGMLSGAVGAHNALALRFPGRSARVEARFCERLGLKPPRNQVSTQIAPPEAVSDLAWATLTSFGVLANLADDMRHLHRSEIAEVREGKKADEVGSSTMPHKVNPKNFENVKGLWKAYAPRAMTVLMDQITEHQRDLTNSASSRFLPELFTALAYATARMRRTMERLEIDEAACRRNIEASAAEVMAEPLYILLGIHGHPDAYDAVRAIVQECRESGRSPGEVVYEREELREYLEGMSDEERAILRDVARYVGDAPERVDATCADWEERAERLRAGLAAPDAQQTSTAEV